MNTNKLINLKVDLTVSPFIELTKTHFIDDIQFKMDIGELPTVIKLKSLKGTIGLSIYSRFISHTGYKSSGAIKIEDDKSIAEITQKYLNKAYSNTKTLPYIVWKEYREHGWPEIGINNGRNYVRIPNWADDVLKEALKYIGFKEDCKINHYWGVCAKELSKQDLKNILKPIFKDGSRLSDENHLASKLKKSYDDFCIEHRSATLFDGFEDFKNTEDVEQNKTRRKKTDDNFMVPKVERYEEIQLSFF